jgi:hypothetical protein
MTLDDREKANLPLGPAETLLLEAADSRFAYHGSAADKVAPAYVAQARAKLPDPKVGTGGELVQQRGASGYLFNTLDYPDFIAADASAQRMHLAKEAGALALGVDTADTIKAQNSAELMLSHQLAAAHAGAMKLMGQLTNMMMMQGNAMRTDDSANVRVTRLAGAASRLMLAYQQGLVTLDRLRAGGKQTIIVQHVQVNDGGQAVVAGKVKPPAKGGDDGGQAVVAGKVKPPAKGGGHGVAGSVSRPADRKSCELRSKGKGQK